MSRMKAVMTGLLAVCMLAAISTASASALSWKVEKKELASKATETIKEATPLSKAAKFSGDGIEVSCTKLSAKKAFIEGATGGGAESFVFTTCIVSNDSSQCEVEKSEVKTKEVTAKLEAGVKVTFAPKGEEFATIKILAKPEETCEVANSYKVTGSVTGNLVDAASELKEQPLAFTTSSGSNMKIGGKVSNFTGEMDLSLASAKTWGAS